VFFSFIESPSNFLLTIKFPKNHIAFSYLSNLPKTAKAIFWPQRTLGVNAKFAYEFSNGRGKVGVFMLTGVGKRLILSKLVIG
jgi:hypothetical protein